jgi:probable HAF family extracellular repeat protein
MKFFTSLLATAALAVPATMIAQDSHSHTPRHHHYKVFDLGTLGGPTSGVPTAFYQIYGTAGARVISDAGEVTATSDTSIADPLCFIDPCLFEKAFDWQDGALTSLGTLPGGQWSAVNWISGNGMIAGFSENGQTDPLNALPDFHATLWHKGKINDLGTLLGGHESWSWAANNRGQAVGFATDTTPDPYSYYYFQILGSSAGTQTRAFLWDEENGMQDLGTLGGPDAWAGLVNERGQVVGISYTSSTPNAINGGCAPNVPAQNPFFWEKDTGMIDMGTFGGTCGVANAINNQGQVAGQSYLAGNLKAHAFLWDEKSSPQLRDLGTLGGDNAAALWINEAGFVVGLADVPNPPSCSGLACVHHGFLWKDSVMTDLGSLGTDPCSRAISINAIGQIVGSTAAVCGGNLSRGFLWENGGPAVDLNSLVPAGSGLTLNEPIYINDRGEIAGNAMLANGDVHAFLLIPCDEENGEVDGCRDKAAIAFPQCREDDAENACTGIHNGPASVPSPTSVADRSLTPLEIAARMHARFSRRYDLGAWPRQQSR